MVDPLQLPTPGANLIQYKTYPEVRTGSRPQWGPRPDVTPYVDTYNRRVYNSERYWQLLNRDGLCASELRAELRGQGVSDETINSIIRDQLLKMSYRAERGLPTYDGRQLRDLRGFIIGRGLAPGRDVGRMGRFALLALLEKADEKANEGATFSRFEELAPEIRTIVYSVHLKNLDTKCTNLPITPPITRTSKLLRKESLPLFYSTCTLFLDKGKFPGLPPTPRKTARQEHIALFQHYSIPDYGDYDRNHMICLKIDMSPKSGLPLPSVTVTPNHQATGQEFAKQIKSAIEGRLQVFTDGLAARKSSLPASSGNTELVKMGLGLQEEDFQAILHVLN